METVRVGNLPTSTATLLIRRRNSSGSESSTSCMTLANSSRSMLPRTPAQRRWCTSRQICPTQCGARWACSKPDNPQYTSVSFRQRGQRLSRSTLRSQRIGILRSFRRRVRDSLDDFGQDGFIPHRRVSFAQSQERLVCGFVVLLQKEICVHVVNCVLHD